MAAFIRPAQQKVGKNKNEGSHVQRWRQHHGMRLCRGWPSGAANSRRSKNRNLIPGAHPAIEIVEVCAAPQRNVLAVVHVLAARQYVRRRAASAVGPLFGANARGSRLQPARRPRKVPPGRRRSLSILFEDISLRVPAQPRTQQDPGFFGRAQPHTFGENIIPARVNPAQQATVNSHESPKRGARIGMNQRDQLHALAITIPCARAFKFQQATHFRRERPARE